VIVSSLHGLDVTGCHACAMSWACGMLVHCHEFVGKKIIRSKIVAIHNIFKEKTTNLNS